MTEFIPQADVIVSLLLTYLIHSTVVVLLIGVVLRCWSAVKADVRVLLWKAALVVPLATSLAVALGVPQAGPRINIASAARSQQSSKFKAPTTGGFTELALGPATPSC